MMIIRVVVSIVSFLALGWTQFTETQNSTESDGLGFLPAAAIAFSASRCRWFLMSAAIRSVIAALKALLRIFGSVGS